MKRKKKPISIYAEGRAETERHRQAIINKRKEREAKNGEKNRN